MITKPTEAIYRTRSNENGFKMPTFTVAETAEIAMAYAEVYHRADDRLDARPLEAEWRMKFYEWRRLI